MFRFTLLVLLATLASAQSTGSLTGSVVDPSGAVIPGARIVSRNIATGAIVEAITQADGYYNLTRLPIGSYELEVKKEGFRTLVRKDVEVITGRTVELRLTLEVGAVGSSVEVSGEVPLVQASSSGIQNSVTARQMEELPLNGRNPLQLVVLTAGAVYSETEVAWNGQSDNRWISVNGLRASQNNYTLDGSNYTNRFFGTSPVMPNPDALEEFTVQSSNFGAATQGAGAVVQLSTRSGTNRLHGALFHFLRNTKLNARNFFQLERPPFKLNQYGGSLGGPIRRDRTFFFYAYQGTAQRSAPSSVVLTTPTAAQRRGDLSSLGVRINDPRTGQQFPDNIIPTERLDRLAQAVLEAYVPLPNRGNQYVSLQNRDIDDQQHTIKVDHSFTQNNRLTGRYFYDLYDFQRPTGSVVGF